MTPERMESTHRRIHAEGRSSVRSTDSGMDILHRLRLERERVRFDEKGAVPLSRFRWQPRGR